MNPDNLFQQLFNLSGRVALVTGATRGLGQTTARTPAEAGASVGRWGEPDELRGLMLYLSSPACSYMTGSSVIIDGGWTAQ